MTTKLAVGTFTPSVLLAVARRLGRLEEQALDIAEVAVPSSPAQFRDLLDRKLDAALTSPDNVVAYRFSPSNPLGATADVTIVSAVDRGLGLGLYLRPGLDRPEQVRGGILGVDVPTSGFALAMYALAESVGVQRGAYELATLGSTPKRLQQLLAGKCDATMLNAGNELLAEQAGCLRVASVSDVCSPYLGTVISVAGTACLEPARRLSEALRRTATDICSGSADQVAAQEAASILSLPVQLADRYVERLKDPTDGLIIDDKVDHDGLRTIVELRRRYLPSIVDGVDPLAQALNAESGLVGTSSTAER